MRFCWQMVITQNEHADRHGFVAGNIGRLPLGIGIAPVGNRRVIAYQQEIGELIQNGIVVALP